MHAAGKPVNEENLKKVLTAAGVKVDETRVKALTAALEGVNIDEALKAAVAMPTAAPAAAPPAEKKEEKKKEEKKEEEKVSEERLPSLACPAPSPSARSPAREMRCTP